MAYLLNKYVSITFFGDWARQSLTSRGPRYGKGGRREGRFNAFILLARD